MIEFWLTQLGNPKWDIHFQYMIISTIIDLIFIVLCIFFSFLVYRIYLFQKFMAKYHETFLEIHDRLEAAAKRIQRRQVLTVRLLLLNRKQIDAMLADIKTMTPELSSEDGDDTPTE